MRRVTLIAILLIQFCPAVYGQTKHQFDFQFDPAAIIINPYNPNRYFYTDEGGVIYTCENKMSRITGDRALGKITSSFFLDRDRGWILGEHGILGTLDGGFNWVDVGQPQLGTQWEQMAYHSMDRMLFVVSKTAGLWMSGDLGRRWIKVRSGSFSGVAFYGLMGVVTGGQPGQGLRTTDGGRSWIAAEEPVVAGRAVHMKDARFVAAGTDDKIYQTVDSGKTWHVLKQLEYQLFGDLAAGCDDIYVPCKQGYYHGRDTAWSYRAVSHRDPVIYGVDGEGLSFVIGHIFKPDLGGVSAPKPETRILADDVIIDAPRCQSIDRLISAYFSPVHKGGVLSIEIIGASGLITIDSTFESTVVGEFDIPIRVHSAGQPDSAVLILRSRAGCKEVFGYVRIYVRPTKTKAEFTSAGLHFPNVSTCVPQQKWMYVRNPDCESNTLEDIRLVGGTTGFALVNVGELPRVIPANSLDSFLVTFSPRLIGSYSDHITVSFGGAQSKRTLLKRISGVGRSGSLARFTNDTLHFGALRSCEGPAVMSSVLQNVGCDAVTIERVRMQGWTGFTLIDDPRGRIIPSGGSETITFELPKPGPNGHNEEVIVYLLGEGGMSMQQSIQLIATPLPDSTAYSLRAPATINGLTTCHTLDTFITITNLSTCSELVITDATAIGNGVAFAPGNYPITLKPAESTTINVHVDGGGLTEINARLVLSTDLFGEIESPLRASVTTPELRTLSAVQPVAPFGTTQCEKIERTITLAPEGCGSLKIGRIELQAPGNNQSQFAIVSQSGPLPIDLPSDGSLSVILEFDPDRPGTAESDLVIYLADGDEAYRCKLKGVVNDTRRNLDLALEIDSPQPLTTDDRVVLTLRTASAVVAGSGLRSIEVDVILDQDIFSPVDASTTHGGNITVTPSPAGLSVRITSPNAFALDPGDVFGWVEMRPNVSTKTSTTIELSGVTLNDGDQDYARCMMSAGSTAGLTTTTLSLDCLERTVQQALEGEPDLSIGPIYPQPASEEIRLDITTERAQEITIEVSNGIGQVVMRRSVLLQAGENPLALPTQSLTKGYYTLTVTGPRMRRVRSLIIH